MRKSTWLNDSELRAVTRKLKTAGFGLTVDALRDRDSFGLCRGAYVMNVLDKLSADRALAARVLRGGGENG